MVASLCFRAHKHQRQARMDLSRRKDLVPAVREAEAGELREGVDNGARELFGVAVL